MRRLWLHWILAKVLDGGVANLVGIPHLLHQSKLNVAHLLLGSPAGLPRHLCVGHITPLVREGLALPHQLRLELGHLDGLALGLLHLLTLLPGLLLKVGHLASFCCELPLPLRKRRSMRENYEQQEHV